MRASWLVGLMVTAAWRVAACAPTPQPVTIAIVATDSTHTPSSLQVSPGQLVNLRLQNDGTVEHDLSLSESPIAEGRVAATPEAGHNMGYLHAGETFTVHVSAQPRQVADVSFTPTEPRTYAWTCTIPGHTAAGRVGTLGGTVPQAPASLLVWTRSRPARECALNGA